MTTKRILTAFAALAAVACFDAPAATPIDRRVDADPEGTLEVHNTAGSIQIEAWNRREVQITGELSDAVERLDVDAVGDRVTVRVVLKERSGWGGNGNTRLVINAPQAIGVEVDAVSASIAVRGMEGEQRLSSVSGSIETEAFSEELRVSSVSGRVHVEGHDQPARTRANSVSGQVTLSNVSGEVHAQSVSGQLDVTSGSLTRAELNSVSGRISVRAGLDTQARVEGTTTSGAVAFMVAGDAAAEYELATFSGRIENCFGPPAPDARGGPPGKEHRFEEGASDASVRITTLSGGIELCRE